MYDEAINEKLNEIAEIAKRHAVTELDAALFDRLLAASAESEEFIISPWTEYLLGRGVKPGTIVWLAYVMLGDAVRRGWVALSMRDMRDEEDEEPPPEGDAPLHIYWGDGLEMNLAGHRYWARLDGKVVE